MKTRHFLPVLLVIFLAGGSYAQPNGDLRQLPVDEQRVIEAIALYPEASRTAILEASRHPEILVRMQNIRAGTEAEFRALLTGMLEADQRAFYDLARYPGLIRAICQDVESRSDHDMDLLLEDYPVEIAGFAMRANRLYYPELRKMNDLLQRSDEAFDQLIASYPVETQQAYRDLVALPEVITILSDHVRLTVLLGDIYNRQPEQLKSQLDSMNLALAEQKARELSDWKDDLESDPQALGEFEAAARDFAADQGYDETETDAEAEASRVETKVYIQYIWKPYPYWFGWPYWYEFECWYPYPWWYHRGFYYGPGNVLVFVGLPSAYFLSWQFSSPANFYYYPHYTNHVINYTYKYPRSNTGMATVVRKWETQVRPDLPNHWFDNDGKRVERIREYGKFETDYRATVRAADQKAPTRQEYLKDHVRKYPTLKPVIQEKPEPAYKPQKQRIDLNKDYKAPVVAPRPKVIEKKPTTPQVIDRAQQYHQITWDKATPKPAQVRPVPKVTPTPKMTPGKTRPSQPKNTPRKQTVPRKPSS